MVKCLGINLPPSSNSTYFYYLEKESGSILNYHFFSENNEDWKNHVNFIIEQVKNYQADQVFIRDFRWMPFAKREITQGWKIVCTLEYLFGEKIFPVQAYKLKSFARRKSRLREFFWGDLTRKEDENFKMSWFYRDKQISQEDLNANYEEWNNLQVENEEN